MIRRLLQVVTLVATLVVGAAAAAIIVSQTSWFKQWLRTFIVREANQYLNGTVSIARLDGNLFFGVELEGVELTTGGQPAVRVKDVGIDYSVLDLVSRGIVIDRLRLNEPVLHLQRRSDGSWNLSGLVKKQEREADRQGPGRPITVSEIGISDGTLVIDEAAPDGTVAAVGTAGASGGAAAPGLAGPAVAFPTRINRLDVKAAFSYSPVRYTVDVGHVSFETERPDVGLRSFSGRISTSRDVVYLDHLAIRTRESSLGVDGVVTGYTTRPVLDLHVSSDKLALGEIARIVPALAGIPLQPAFEVRAKGSLDRLHLVAEVRSAAGTVAGDVTADLTPPARRVAGLVRLAHFDLAPVLRAPAVHSDITGRAVLDLRIAERSSGGPLGLLNGTYDVDASRIVIAGYDVRQLRAAGRIADGSVHVANGSGAAYGGRASVAGVITPGTPLTLDVRGRAQGLDLRLLPAALRAPKMATSIAAAYHVAGSLGPAGRLVVDARFAPSLVAGARLAEGSIAHVTLDRGRLGYQAEGHVTDLDLQQIGQGLGIGALSTDRFHSSVTSGFSVTGQGTALTDLALDAHADLERSSIFGGTLQAMRIDAGVRDAGLRAAAHGSFSGFDLATLGGDPRVAGTLAGQLDVDATVANLGTPAGLDNVTAEGRVTLANSRVADVAIDRAVVDGRFAGGAGDIRTLQVTGPDLSIDATGHVDLNPSGATQVQYTATLPRLEALARFTGQTSLTGSVSVDGSMTGTGRDLKTTGTLHASNVKAGSSSVLAATSQYTASVPGLDPRRVDVSADTTASLVEAGGMKLTEVRARTTWRDQVLGVDATLRDQSRTLAAKGDLLLHPDHQEVHLQDLSLRTQGAEWHTDGQPTAIQYAGGRVFVDHLAFVSGPQRLEVQGAFGRPDDRLRVQATAIDLAGVDRLALGTGRFSGSLDVSAIVGGTREAPRVDATFSVTNGAFRGFQYASLGGTVGYTSEGARIDARLDQAPGAWIAVKGTVPAAAMRTAPGRRPGEHEVPPPGQGIDVAVTSSALNLAIVEGFVPQLTRVSGTLQADLTVLGTVADPHLQGHVDIRNGAFTVEQLTNGGYTGLDTRIEFTRDRVHIGEFRVLDEHQHTLSVSGDLAVHRREVGQVQIAVKTDQFEVIDNELADVKLTSDLRVGGELSAPRIDGSVAIHTGTINVDQALEQLTSSAYSETPTDLSVATGITPGMAGLPAVAPAPTAPGRPSPAVTASEAPTPYQALALDVRLRVPDNLVVKGNDLNPSGTSPVALGNVNVTLGGDLRVTKKAGDALRILGDVNTVRGTYDFQGRRFEIARDGRIQFVGGPTLDPRLDITATRLISGVQAQVHVRGSARRPQLALSSQPPLDEADILSLIVFNQPVNQLGEGQQVSLAARAGSLATGFLASSIAQSIGNALELDVLEVDTAPENGGGASVTVGEQVGERLFFKFRQAFGAQSVSELILEYQIAEYLRLQTSVAEGAAATERTLMQRVEQGGIDLIFYFAY